MSRILTYYKLIHFNFECYYIDKLYFINILYLGYPININ